MVRQLIEPLKTSEVARIRNQSVEFETKQINIKETMRSMIAFEYTCENPYIDIDKVKRLLKSL